MQTEKLLAEYVAETQFRDLPEQAVSLIRNVVLNIIGTTIAGADAVGCREVIELTKRWGGAEEASLLVHGGKVPAHNAALANSIMARAVDLDDVMTPGIHIGASSVPTALAAAELAGGCSGKDFLAALVLGTEVGSRINAASDYNGFDPVGVCTVFTTASVAGKILGLNARQVLDALGLAFNKAGGSFQSNVDGSLAVRMIQGFASQNGVLCAELAQAGITGPRNFLEGIHGYFHLYARDKRDIDTVAGDLGTRFELSQTVFKQFPSSGSTITPTRIVLDLIREEGIGPDDVAEIKVKVTPMVFKLGGHPFEIGDNPTVNGQFSIQYCVANAFIRNSSKLEHFEPDCVKDPKIMEFARRVGIQPDAEMDKRGMTSTDMEVTTRDGRVFQKGMDVPPGFPGNPFTPEEYLQLFQGCIGHAARLWPRDTVEKIISLVRTLEQMEDVRQLVPLLLNPSPGGRPQDRS